MFRYPGLAKIIDNPEGEVSEDPYDHKEADEEWKIQSLQDHVLPQTCTAAKELVEKGLREKELDVFALLEITSKRRRKCLPMFQ